MSRFRPSPGLPGVFAMLRIYPDSIPESVFVPLYSTRIRWEPGTGTDNFIAPSLPIGVGQVVDAHTTRAPASGPKQRIPSVHRLRRSSDPTYVVAPCCLMS